MARSLVLKAPAKINLGLTVLSRREDGFHDLQSVMQQISLFDTLVFEPVSGKGLHFFCTDQNLSGPENLVRKAAALLEGEVGRSLPGIKITLYKNIPVEAGLAGGSADCAAALAGLNRLWQLKYDHLSLQKLGLRLGSDVPFCLQGGTALAGGRGEKLEQLPDLPYFWVVLALPEALRLSTAAVYQNFDKTRMGEPEIAALVEAIKNGNRSKILSWLSQDLTNTLETAKIPGSDILLETKYRLQKKGLQPILSGSGPALFLLMTEYESARKAARMIEEENCRAYFCWTCGKKAWQEG